MVFLQLNVYSNSGKETSLIFINFAKVDSFLLSDGHSAMNSATIISIDNTIMAVVESPEWIAGRLMALGVPLSLLNEMSH